MVEVEVEVEVGGGVLSAEDDAVSDPCLWPNLAASWAACFSLASSSSVPERGGECMPEVGVETGVEPATTIGGTGTGASCGSGAG